MDDSDPAPARIWIVDDSALEAANVVSALADRFAPTLFPDGDRVLEALAIHAPPDVLILDWMLPSMSGLEVCAFLRANAALREIPVLMLTARDTEDDLVEALEAGADDYIAKPFQPRELQARVAALLRRRGARRDASSARTALGALLGCLPDAALAVDDADVVVLANPDARTLFADPQRLLGRALSELIPGLALDAALSPLPDQELNGRTYAPALRVLPPGSPARAAVILKDVTARRRVEAALRRSEASLRALMDSTLFGVFFWNARGAVSEANDTFLAMLGATRAELEAGALRWTDATPAEHAARDREALAEVEARGACAPYEKEFLRRDGVRVPVLVGATGLDGASSRGIAFVLDISARRRAEAAEVGARLALDDATREARARDQFVGEISHELRTPLNAILGWTRMLRTGVLTDEARTRALQTIERNAMVQARLVEDLLDLSRVANGKLQIAREPVDVRAAAEAALEAVRPAALTRGLALEDALGEGPAVVHGDERRLQQVLLNLLTNAVKFTPAGGTVRLLLARDDRQVEIRVADTGRGIEPALLPHVFERFRQGSAASGDGPQVGLGLGLAIAHNVVQMHGGEIEAQSAGPGRGATFVVRLPR